MMALLLWEDQTLSFIARSALWVLIMGKPKQLMMALT
jgi:hypothetical protein